MRRRLVCLLTAVMLLLASVPPAGATEPSPAPDLPAAARPAPEQAWGYNFWKAVTYEVAASTDAVVFGLLFGASTTSGGLFAVGNFLLAGGLYYLHEMSWSALGPDPDETDGVWLSVTKALTYRVVSTTRVVTTSLLLTGSPWLAGGYAIANNLIDTAVYLGNDALWAWFGPPAPYLGERRGAPAPAAAATAR